MSTSRSRATTTTATETTNISRNLNLQDTEGVTVGEAGGDVTIIQTDQNAFDNASDLARRSLEVGESISGDALRLSLETTEAVTASNRAALDAVAGSTEEVRNIASGAIAEVGNVAGAALSFGDRAFGTVEKALGEVSGAYSEAANVQTRAVEAVQETQAGALSTVTNLFRDAFAGLTNFVGDLQSQAQSQVGSTVEALNAIAVEQNKSSDQRIAEISGNAIRYVVIAVGVIAGGAVLFAIFRSK